MPLQEGEVAQAKTISQKAVVVIGRTAGEDTPLPPAGEATDRIFIRKIFMSVIVTSKRFALNASSAVLALAQTGCNLLLNGCVVATIQTHGALGKQITQKLCRIDMTAGNYLLQFEATKPGMAIDWLGFRQVTD
ncbi:hypothetical protein NFK79_17590 [Citrobacter freundii]|nr:hypothetical protein [Citrobacter freundii]WFZ83921.1 hypothetical protein NFK79_17590 [Citrobacter freundii]